MLECVCFVHGHTPSLIMTLISSTLAPCQSWSMSCSVISPRPSTIFKQRTCLMRVAVLAVNAMAVRVRATCTLWIVISSSDYVVRRWNCSGLSGCSV